MAQTHLTRRPLSPHLSVYRIMFTMVMSMAHRLSGVALYVGALLLAWWLLAIAAGPGPYAAFDGFIGSILGRIVLFLATWALIHHTLGGIRHFIWDVGRGHEVATVELLARATIVGSFVLTILVWALGYWAR
jgi:succinate dehydrogenase / fumarate reductase cytochrome b subunit